MTSPLLPPPDGSHRERLLAGMAAAVRHHGFRQTTVADVVARARTSRRTFYQHFEDREACFLALFDLLNDRVVELIADAATGEGPWATRVDRTLAAYLEAVAADPALTRACIQEIPSVGEAGVLRVQAMTDRTARQLVRLADEAASHDPTLRPLPYEAAVLITGGFPGLVIAALDQERDLTELQSVVGDLILRITVRPAASAGA